VTSPTVFDTVIFHKSFYIRVGYFRDDDVVTDANRAFAVHFRFLSPDENWCGLFFKCDFGLFYERFGFFGSWCAGGYFSRYIAIVGAGHRLIFIYRSWYQH